MDEKQPLLKNENPSNIDLEAGGKKNTSMTSLPLPWTT